jgi:diguanylate cyclase
MEGTLVFGSHAATTSALKSVASAARHSEGGDASDRTLARAIHRPGIDATYAGISSGLARELAAAQQLIEKLNADNMEMQRQLGESRLREAQMRDDAYHDELTGLPNRRLLNDRLQQERVHAMRRKQQVALLLIDLDGFKAINDTFGHAVGDQLLCEVATRLVGCLRASDTACRYGGDEFVVLIPELSGQLALEIVINKIRRCIEEPYLICGTEMRVGASIGCAVSPAEDTIFQALIEKADAEMYRVKAQRKQIKD